ncbi:MAG: alpha/beta fold hydrolase [Phycisphaerae bacterium]
MSETEHVDSPTYIDHRDLSYYLDAMGEKNPIQSISDWEIRRRHILQSMQRVMGKAPDRAACPAPEIEILDQIETAHYTRRKISFTTGANESPVPAYLLIPREIRGRLAAMLCLHQTTPIGKDEPAGLGGNVNLHYAHELAERGHVCLAPDYPGFGEHRFTLGASGHISGSMKAISDNHRAVDLLQTLPQVDSDRIGCIGHSLGGHNAIFTAVFDPRIKAVVSNCGFCSFRRYMNGDLTGWSSEKYMPLIKTQFGTQFGCDPSKMPFDFEETIAALAPRPFLAIAPAQDSNFDLLGVREVIESAQPIYKLLGKEKTLQASYPRCGHEFTVSSRRQAYAFLDKHLS